MKAKCANSASYDLGNSTVLNALKRLSWGLFGVIVGSLVYTNEANAEEFATQAYDACANAESLQSDSFANLDSQGWDVPTSASAEVKELLADGLLASTSTNRDTQINWTSSQIQAVETASAMLSAVSTGIGRLFVSEGEIQAVLFAFDRPIDANWYTVHCVYGGPLGAEMASMAETVKRMDSRAGVTQATKGLYIFTIQSQGSTETVPAKRLAVDAQIGVFTDDSESGLVRTPAVEAGFSVFRHTEK